MALIWADPGTEHTFDTTHLSSVTQGASGGIVDSSTAQSHSGSRSLRCLSGTAGASSRGGMNAVLADAGRRVSFWMYMATLPTSGTYLYFLGLNNNAGNSVLVYRVSSAGKLSMVGDHISFTQFGAEGSATLVAGQWYQICVSYTITSTTNWHARLYVGNSLDLDRTNTDGTLTNTGTDQIRWGWNTSNNDPTAGNAAAVYFDDIVIDDVNDLSYIGDVRCTAKLPTTTNTNGYDTTGGTGAVNERPTSNTNYRQQAATTQASQTYNLEACTAGDYDLTACGLIGHIAWMKASTAVADTVSLYHDGAVVSKAVTTTAAFYYDVVTSTTYPNTTGNIVGQRSTGTANDSFLYECGMIVAYSLPKTISMGGSITPTGVATRRLVKQMAGTVTPGGVVTRQTSRLLAGSTSPVGTLLKQGNRKVSGAVTPTGAATAWRVFLRSASGSISPTGSVAPRVGRLLTGTITPVGVPVRKVSRLLSGLMSAVGSLQVNVPVRSLTSDVSFKPNLLSDSTQQAVLASDSSNEPNLSSDGIASSGFGA